ncbi:hypothetical protein D3C73_1222410 [compost metagenome]
MEKGLLNGEVSAFDIDGELPVELLLRCFSDQGIDHDSGIIDDDINFAEHSLGLIEQPGNLLRLADIRLKCRCPAALLLNPLHHFLCLPGAAGIINDNGRSLLRQLLRNTPSDAS